MEAEGERGILFDGDGDEDAREQHGATGQQAATSTRAAASATSADPWAFTVWRASLRRGQRRSWWAGAVSPGLFSRRLRHLVSCNAGSLAVKGWGLRNLPLTGAPAPSGGCLVREPVRTRACRARSAAPGLSAGLCTRRRVLSLLDAVVIRTARYRVG